MKAFATLGRGITVAAMASMLGGAPALAGTFVYVSNADDGDISTYSMQPDGKVLPGARLSRAVDIQARTTDSVAISTRLRPPFLAR